MGAGSLWLHPKILAICSNTFFYRFLDRNLKANCQTTVRLHTFSEVFIITFLCEHYEANPPGLSSTHVATLVPSPF
jgi:hypothetical protein